MEKGKIIVMEGVCDGIGKTTQYELLKEKLKGENKKIITHHFPTYGSEQGKLAEKYLSGDFGNPEDLSPYFVNSFFAIDRAITWGEKLKPVYDEGGIVLLDRYTTSTLIYQSCFIDDIEEKKEFLNYTCDYEYHKLGIKEPDHVVFLYAPFDVVTKNREQRKENDGIENDIHESNIEILKKAYHNALFVADYLGWDKIDSSYGNEMRPIEDIHKDICKLIKKR